MIIVFFVGGKTRSCGIGMGYKISIVIIITNSNNQYLITKFIILVSIIVL
jgi:hypothetical protein